MSRIALAAAFLVCCGSAYAGEGEWTMDPAASRLEFTATFENSPAPGVFRKFNASVRFDPDRLPESRIDVIVVVPSADMKSDDINRAILGPEWFDVERFPSAEFQSTQVRSAGANAYIAAGTLKLKGISQPIEVPFSWKAEGDTATMQGELGIDRAGFKIGLGEWLSTKEIGADVRVKFLLQLRKSR